MGEYAVKRRPATDLGNCTDCRSCVEMRPDVFRSNPDTGVIEVLERDEYPEDIQEVMAVCPADCIYWEEE
jgi:ferredoxin